MEGEFALVIAEKPDAARRIAEALGRSSPDNNNSKMIEVKAAFDGKSYVVCSAIGHLFEIEDPDSNRSVYPAYDMDWFRKGAVKRKNKRGRDNRFQRLIQQRIDEIRSVARKAKYYINACDYDLEGETIGSNILAFACGNPENVLRAKFSTLSKEDLRGAFSSLEHSSDQLARAGRMRHTLDFLWGVNLSRALTQLVNSSKSEFSNVTIGRVQGPTLAFVADREIERESHVPIPSWEVSCKLKKNETVFQVIFKDSPVPKKKFAESVYEAASKSEFAPVSDLQASITKIPPRYPFNISDLQKEAFYSYRMSPSMTLAVAEKLYLRALISYPRTQSQRLPPSLRPEQILFKIRNWPDYTSLVESLLSEPSRRKYLWQGPKDDPAHPAIHPTGEVPKQPLSSDEKRILDLIVRRFCGAFAPDAIMEKTTVTFDISSYYFAVSWERVIDEGWMRYYPARRPPSMTPLSFSLSEQVPVIGASLDEKFSKAPARYNEGSLLAKMESEGIGTKATRAETIATLIDRGYFRQTRDIVPEENALLLIQHLRENCPEIVSPSMTRSLETKLDAIQLGREDEALLIAEEMTAIRSNLRKLMRAESITWAKPEQKKIGNLILGKCPACKTGDLIAIRSFRTKRRFIRCSNYEANCKTSSPLPPRGRIITTKDVCSKCGWPLIVLVRSRSSTRTEECSNFGCKSDQLLGKD